MTIPNYETLMLPLLEFLKDGREVTINEISSSFADLFNLTSEEKELRIPSGQVTVIKSRTGWARTYLKKAGLVTSPKRGLVKITDRGLSVLSQKPPTINNTYLMQFAEFVDFVKSSNKTEETDSSPTIIIKEKSTPEEIIDQSYQQLRTQLADELLDIIFTCPPDFFEKLVIDLIVSMGYGGSRTDAAQATQRSNDGGIDGIIKEDKLGLDAIYLQAKRWNRENKVGRPEIQKFAGALQGVRARKGIFITTSTFSDGCREFINSIDSKIVLIDGDLLCQLLIDYNIGVSSYQKYEIKRVDGDYFIEG